MVVKAIDFMPQILGDFIKEPRLILIAGHPGSGKTTLAMTMCLHAMNAGERCFYISFQEDRERLFKQLAGVGIELKPYEDKGLLKLIKLPLVVSEGAIQELVEGISREVMGFSPRLIVIDSITPLLISIKDDAKARGLLQNFFWELHRLINGSVVLLAEVPLGRELAGLGWAEFVVDAVVVLKYRTYKGLVERVMEVKKVRGRELNVAELPFSIQKNVGIVFHQPMKLSEIKSSKKRRLLAVGPQGPYLKESTGPSIVTLIEYPPELTLSLPLLYSILLHMASSNYGKLLIIEYWSPEDRIKDFMMDSLKLYGADEEVIKRILDNIVIRPLNPTAYSSPELFSMILDIVNDVKPMAVIFHDVALPTKTAVDVSYYASLVYNLLLYLKSIGIDVVRLCSRVDSFTDLYKVMSDHVVSIRCKDSICDDYVVYDYIEGKIVRRSWTELEEEVKTLIGYLKNQIPTAAQVK